MRKHPIEAGFAERTAERRTIGNVHLKMRTVACTPGRYVAAAGS